MSGTARVLVALLIGVGIAGVGAGFAMLSPDTEPVACTMDARLDAPEGWTWHRDGTNNCAWTLYDADGSEAPDDVYTAIGEEPPPPPPTDLAPWLVLGAGIVTIGVAIGAAVSLRRS